MPNKTIIDLDSPTQLMRGDSLGGRIVAGVRTMRTLVHVDLVAGGKTKLPIDKPVRITRDVPTNEEVVAKQKADAAEMIAFYAERIQKRIDASESKVDAALENLSSHKRTNASYQAYYLETYAEAVAEYTHMQTLLDRVENQSASLAQAVIIYAAQLREAVLQNQLIKSSSSAFTNAVSLVEQDVATKFLRDLDVTGIESAVNKLRALSSDEPIVF